MRRMLVLMLSAILLALPGLAASEAVVRRGDAAGKIALSFDDGPDPVYTREILSILKEYGCTATFFIIGKSAAAYPEIVREIADAGHELANHTYTHTFLKNMTLPQLCAEVTKTSDLLEELTGKRPVLFRPPGGSYSDRKIETLSEMGYTSVLWSKDTRDWSRPSVAVVVEKALTDPVGGDIILFHDANTKGSPTPEALRRVIPELQSRGFTLCTVSELLAEH